MIGFAMHTTILTLWKQGKSKNEIARVTGKDRKTVRKLIQRYEQFGEETPVSKNIVFRQQVNRQPQISFSRLS